MVKRVGMPLCDNMDREAKKEAVNGVSRSRPLLSSCVRFLVVWPY